MSETKSPDGTFPAWPQTLPVDGELVTNDWLVTSASADRGTLGKLIDAVGWLKARSCQVFNFTTDGAGNVVVQRRTPKDDGSTAFFSSVVIVTDDTIRCTFTTPLASDRDCASIVHNQLTGPTDRYWYVAAATTTTVDLQYRDISVGALIDLAATSTECVLICFPNLAGYT